MPSRWPGGALALEGGVGGGEGGALDDAGGPAVAGGNLRLYHPILQAVALPR